MGGGQAGKGVVTSVMALLRARGGGPPAGLAEAFSSRRDQELAQGEFCTALTTILRLGITKTGVIGSMLVWSQ
jgi:hypothetical protein